VDYVNKWLRLKVTREWYAGSKESAALQILPVVTSVEIYGSTDDVGLNTTRTFTANVLGKGAPLPQAVEWSVSGQTSAETGINENGVLSVASDETIGGTLAVTAASKFDPEHSGTATVIVANAFTLLPAGLPPEALEGGSRGLIYGNGRFQVVVFEKTSEGEVAVLLRSEDGISWDAKPSPVDEYALPIKYIEGKFFGLDNNGLFHHSTDGETWEPASDLDADFKVRSVAFGKDLFVAVGDKGRAAWSLDGETWAMLAIEKLPFYYGGFLGDDDIIVSIAFGGGRFVAMGVNSEVALSQDGEAWTPISSGTIFEQKYENSSWNGPKITGLAYGNGRFIAVSDDGRAAWSENGESWNPVSVTGFSSGSEIKFIAFGGGKFVAAGDDGKAAYSDDGGETWNNISVPGVDFDTEGIAYGNGRFVVVSDTGKIAYSNLQE
jgi:photosystem II stability/assembly factor-like uncharacterized protein